MSDKAPDGTPGHSDRPVTVTPSSSTTTPASCAATSTSYATVVLSNITTQDPYLDLMARFKSSVTIIKQTNPRKTHTNPSLGYTENYSRTYLDTGNPCLDFFFHVVPTTSPEELKQLLQSAWNRSPLTALKLVCNLRGVRGMGKSDKEGFYTAAMWLHRKHPQTLACNIGAIAEFGYFKDFLEILFRLLEGKNVREKVKVNMSKLSREERKAAIGSNKKKGPSRRNPDLSRAERKIAAKQRKAEEEAEARKLRLEKKFSAADKLLRRLSNDQNFEFLYDSVAELFSIHLISDIENLNSGNINKISLAAKWCPSLNSSYDETTLLCESIARKIFPKESDPEYETIEDAHYAYRVRDRLRKEILVPIRKVLELPEVYIGTNRWGSIPYNRVASVAMNMYKEKFLKHDKDRFEEYLRKVGTGESKIAAGALLPHKIIAALGDGDGGQVAELQWARMVDDMAKKGKLRNCLAVCDVSGSMRGTPMEVAVALGLLVSELSDDPWKGKVVTFSACPRLQSVAGDSLKSKTEFIREMDWGYNTDFQKVFDLILEVAEKVELPCEEMIKRVFVFSDMEFDQASSNPWETDYMAIRRKFFQKGYGGAVPEIVFWNLRASKATPVMADQAGVALVSGYSKNLLKVFLNEGGIINPEFVMEAAISGEEYGSLFVFD